MANPSPLPNDNNHWLLLGAINPSEVWQELTTPFKNTTNILRVSSFSQTKKYERYCYIRVKYNVTNNPLYDRWIRVYPNQELSLIKLNLINELNSTPKSLQIIDYQLKKAIERSQNGEIVTPVYRINWVLSVSILA